MSGGLEYGKILAKPLMESLAAGILLISAAQDNHLKKGIEMLKKLVALTVLLTAPLQAQTIDCDVQSAGLEPAGYAAQCGPFDANPFGPSPFAPTDSGTMIDLRGDSGPIDTMYSFVINNFPGATPVAVTNNRVFALDYDETGTVIYAIPGTTATANPNTLGTIDPATGIFTAIAPLTGAPNANGLTIDPTTGDAYIADATTLYSLDLATAVATSIGTIDAAALFVDLAMDCNGQIYAHDIAGDLLYSVDSSTGVGTSVGPTGLPANFAQGMDFDNEDGTLYGFVYTGGGTNTFGSFDLGTGAVTPLAQNNPLGEWTGTFPGTCGGPTIPIIEVPTLGQLGLLLLALMLLGSAVIVIRRH